MTMIHTPHSFGYGWHERFELDDLTFLGIKPSNHPYLSLASRTQPGQWTGLLQFVIGLGVLLRVLAGSV